MANFGRVKTWGAEILQPTDLNAEFDNIINNVTANTINAANIDETASYTWSGTTVLTNNAAAASGDLPVLTLQTDPVSGTATDGDGIYVTWKGDDDGGAATEFGRQHLEFDDTGASSEDSSWHWSVVSAASLVDILTVGHTSGAGRLVLKNQATAVTDGIKLGQIDFQAPAEASGTDSILVGASIWAEADDTFAADNNDTDLVFAVAESEAAAERMRLAYDGTATALSFTTATAIDTGGNNALTLNPGTAALTVTAGDLTLYDDNNNADTSMSLGTSATERLKIEVLNGAANKSAESVNIVTQTAAAGANAGQITVGVDDATILTIDDGGINAILGATTPAALTCTTFTSTGIDDNASGATAIYINSSEEVAINDATPTASIRFQVYEVANRVARFESGNATAGAVLADFFSAVGGAGSVVSYIEADGDWYNVNGTYGAISDERLKQDITTARSYWDDWKQILVRKFRLKSQVETRADAQYYVGPIAQELEIVFPRLVETADSGYKQVKTSILGILGHRVLQEAQLRIEALEDAVAVLKTRI